MVPPVAGTPLCLLFCLLAAAMRASLATASAQPSFPGMLDSNEAAQAHTSLLQVTLQVQVSSAGSSSPPTAGNETAGGRPSASLSEARTHRRSVFFHRVSPSKGMAALVVPVNNGNRFWFGGIFLTLLGQTLCVAGLQLQKISHLTHTTSSPPKGIPTGEGLLSTLPSKASLDISEVLVDSQGYSYVKLRWMLGGAVWALGHVMCWFALGLAPQSVLACIQSWNIIVNFALAPHILGEKIPENAMRYSLFLIGGCTLVAVCGPKPTEYTMQTVDSLATAFVGPASLAVHFACAWLLCAAGCTPWLQGTTWRVERLVAISVTCAWYAALCLKSMSTLVITSVSTNNSQMANPGFYVFVLGFATSAAGQIHFLNRALKHGVACAVIPMYEGLSFTGQVVFGGILFGEFKDFDGRQELGFWPGTLLVLVGLLLLVDGNPDEELLRNPESLPKTTTKSS